LLGSTQDSSSYFSYKLSAFETDVAPILQGRFCKEHELQIDYKRRARAWSSCLLLKSDERMNENTANGWEMLPGGFRPLPYTWSRSQI
jgi:hypothetical protein